MPDESDNTAHRSYEALDNALAAHQIPLENHSLIRQFCESVGIERYEDRSGYIKGVRSGHGPALQIHYGWTNGFLSEEEARAACGDAPCWASGRGTELWGVTHPVHRIGQGGGGPVRPERHYGTCLAHNIALPASGICDECN